MKTQVIDRYTKESEFESNLSCGNNIVSLALKKGERVLDMGCGKGLESIEFAKRVGNNGLVYGIDITPKMIDTAKENAKGLKNISFMTGDIENLPFDDNIFDAVSSNCVINHAKDKKRVYKEIRRVLKKGGRFVISDAVTKNPLPIEIKNDPEMWGQCFGGAITYDEYIDSVSKAGFEKIEILNKRQYLKNGYDFISVTIRAYK